MSNLNNQAQAPEQQYKHQDKPPTENGKDTFVGEGKSNAITVNTPFTVIPGLPELNKILKKLDRTTQQDLGFTFKASTAKVENTKGNQSLKVSLDYIGFGVMSSKFNVQFSPLSVKIETGNLDTEAHWGCSASVLSSPIGLVHKRAGVKGTFSDCNGSRTFSVAPEFSYQSSKTFKPLSTATGGYFFGDSATFTIPNLILPIIEKIKTDSPSLEEWEIIAEHVLPVIPAVQIGRLLDQQIEVVSGIANTALANVESALAATEKMNGVYLVKPQQHHSDDKLQTVAVIDVLKNQSADKASVEGNSLLQQAEPASQQKSQYIVKQNDTLSSIGQKTGHPWMEIYALNKSELKNNPNKIYPGQQLGIPNNHDHITLIEHPVVKAQILANLAKHHEAIAQNTNNKMESAA